jgi:hypothetical protein
MSLMLCLILGVVFAHASYHSSQAVPGGKPDLIIDHVSYFLLPPQPRSSSLDRVVYPRSGLCQVSVRNIGTGDFADAFYIATAETESDIRMGHYSHCSRVNDNKVPIPVDSSIVIPVHIFALPSGTVIKFLVQSDGKPHLRNALPVIDELNYDNNTYEFTIPDQDK